jgi:hypothetical protein
MLAETEERDFLEGNDGVYYTPVRGVEARRRWCPLWGARPGCPTAGQRWFAAGTFCGNESGRARIDPARPTDN